MASLLPSCGGTEVVVAQIIAWCTTEMMCDVLRFVHNRAHNCQTLNTQINCYPQDSRSRKKKKKKGWRPLLYKLKVFFFFFFCFFQGNTLFIIQSSRKFIKHSLKVAIYVLWVFLNLPLLKALRPITFSSPRAQPEVVYFWYQMKAHTFLIAIQNFSSKFFVDLEI